MDDKVKLSCNRFPYTCAYSHAYKHRVTCYTSLQIQCYLPLQLTNAMLPATPAYKYSVTCYSSLQIQCYLPLQLTNTVLPTTPAYKYSVTCYSSLQIQYYLPLQLTKNGTVSKATLGEIPHRAHMGFSERIYLS